MKYKSKSKVIEAEQFFFVGNPNPHQSVKHKMIITDSGEPKLIHFIETLEGNMLVNEGDWIIKGIKGEFYPCRPDIFELSYELCEEL